MAFPPCAPTRTARSTSRSPVHGGSSSPRGDRSRSVVFFKRAGVLLVVLALAAALLGAQAGAKKRHSRRHGWATQVTLAHPSDTQFTGTVSSRLKACHRQRLVTVDYTDPFTGQTQPVSVQRTKKSGKYRVYLTHPAYGGTYRAQAPKVSKRGTQLCRAGRSPPLTVAAVSPVP